MADSYDAGLGTSLFDTGLDLAGVQDYNSSSFAADGPQNSKLDTRVNSPAFTQGSYQVNSMVPMKRPREMYDTQSASPTAGMITDLGGSDQDLVTSLSGQNTGFSNNMNGSMRRMPPHQIGFGQTMSFQQLQHSGSEGSQSPMANIPQHRGFNGSILGGHQNSSPSPFSTNTAGFASSQAMDPRMRMTTPASQETFNQLSAEADKPSIISAPHLQPQHGGMSQSQGVHHPQASAPQNGQTNVQYMQPNSTPAQYQAAAQANTSAQPQNAMLAASARADEIKIQQRRQQFVQNQQRSQQMQPPQQLNPVLQQQQQHHQNHLLQAQALQAAEQSEANVRGPSGSMPPTNPVARTTPTAAQRLAQDVISKYANYMARSGVIANLTPAFCGKPIHFWVLWSIVSRLGGSTKISQVMGWPTVALQVGFPTQFAVMAGSEMEQFWMTQVQSFETVYWRAQKPMSHQDPGALAAQQRQMQAAANNSLQRPMTGQPHSTILTKPILTDEGHPLTRPASNSRVRTNPYGPSPNELLRRSESVLSINRPGVVSRQSPAPDGQPHSSRPSVPQRLESPRSVKTEVQAHSSDASPDRLVSSSHRLNHSKVAAERLQSLPQEIVDSAAHFAPKVRHPETIGRLDPQTLDKIRRGVDQGRYVAPRTLELGLIDIHALSKSIQSGIQSEVRIALETLITVTGEPLHGVHGIDIDAAQAEDLVESLIDGAEYEIDQLICDDFTPSHESRRIESYEDVHLAASDGLINYAAPPRYGTKSYDRERAVTMLVGYLDVLRNLSFGQRNEKFLGETRIVKPISSIVQILAVKASPWLPHTDRLLLMKILVTLLSNVAHEIDIDSSEDARALLDLILAFAPRSPPDSLDDKSLRFISYRVNNHPYLPAAVDALVKLLARDAANHDNFRTILTSDRALLAQAFGLTIAVIPKYRKDVWAHLIDREATLQQSMLAADIICSMIPSSDCALAQAWLSSSDMWAANLYNIITFLSTTHVGPDGREVISFRAISSHGISVLKTLADLTTLCKTGPSLNELSLVPGLSSLLSTLQLPNLDRELGSQLVAYSEVCRSGVGGA